MITASRPLDATKEQQVQFRADVPIRFSRLVAHLRAHAPLPNVEAAIAEFERERQTAAICQKHGPLADPIALWDVPNNRMVFACPNCTTNEELVARWKAEGERS